MDKLEKKKFYIIASVYILPLLAWSLFSLQDMPAGKGLFYLGIGWLLMGGGGLYLYLQFSKFQSKPALATIGEPFLEEVKKEREQNLQAIDRLQEEKGVIELERQTIEKEMERLRHEVLHLKMGSIEALRQKERELQDLKKQLHSHRHQIEEKQTLLQTLQGKVSDLTFEIKTLVELHNRIEPQATQKDSSEKQTGHKLLKRCLDIAKKYMGPNLFQGIEGGQSLTLDQRRLFEAFLEEKSGVVFYFSPKEGKILFVNTVVEELMGCSSDNFRFEFGHFIKGSEEVWRQGVQQLTKASISDFQLQLTLPSGKEAIFQCTLGRIPSGLFHNDVIGILI